MTTDWKDNTLRELATINYGRSPSGILEDGGMYPVIGTGGSERVGSDYLYDGDSIILGRKGTIDRVLLATGRFWVIDTAYYLTNFTDAFPPWLYYFLQTLDLRQLNEATGVPSLSRDILYKIGIPTPPETEQEKIAEILSTVDRAIEQTEALIAKQQRIKTGLMQDLLTRGIDEHGNLRSEATHEFKDSPLGRVPVEWNVETLETRASVKGGKRLPAGHTYAESETGYRYLQTTDFINRRLTYAALHSLFLKTFRVLERYEIRDGDIFISIAGVNLGVAGVFRPDFEDHVILTENAAKICVTANEVPEYISWQINGPIIQRQIAAEKGVGAGVPKLALFRIQQLLMVFPDPDEQARIVTRLQAHENGITKTNGRFLKLELLKTALMQDLLTGKKRVTPLLELEPTNS
jgi:type I restriction enzyme S subunit